MIDERKLKLLREYAASSDAVKTLLVQMRLGVTDFDWTSDINVFKLYLSYLGKQITSLNIKNDKCLRLDCSDGSVINFFDGGQSCCEARYITTDDNLEEFRGALLLSVELRDAPNIPDQDGEHEVAFLVIRTSKGTFTLRNHNEHNGYYGGFSLTCATTYEPIPV